MARKALLIATILLATIGIVLATIPFTTSMKPSERAKSARSQHDISKLQSGEYLFEKFGRKAAWDEKVLIIRDWDGEIYSYLVPTIKGKVSMPEKFWGWGYYQCEDFRPTLNSDKRILESGVIACHDTNAPDWGKKVWKWSYDGKSKYHWIADMYAPGFEVKSDVLYINR